MKVVVSRLARSQLREIAFSIARDNPGRAKSFVEELRAKAVALAETPHGFPVVERFAHRGLRRRVHRDYLIFYRVGDDAVCIVAVLHGARDYEPLLSVALSKD